MVLRFFTKLAQAIVLLSASSAESTQTEDRNCGLRRNVTGKPKHFKLKTLVMKKIYTLIISAFSLTAFAQTNDTLFVSKLTDLEWIKSYENKTKFLTIKFYDGSSLKVGDKMLLGKPSGSNNSNQQTAGILGTTNQNVN